MVTLKGAVAALSGAILWAYSAVLFEQLSRKISPIKLNFLKGSIAAVLLTATSLLLGETFQQINRNHAIILIVSGILGIAIGDSAYFAAVKRIGARRALLLFTLSPPITALIALFFLGEHLPASAWIGIIITIAGVMWVVTEQSSSDSAEGKNENLVLGILLGIAAAACQGIGIVLTRSVLVQASLTTLQSTVLRLISALVFLGFGIIIRNRKNRESDRVQFDRKLIGSTFLSAFIGAYICLWLQQIAVENLSAGIAQTLLSTSPVFILPIAMLRGERISVRAILGAVLAVMGVMLIFGLFG